MDEQQIRLRALELANDWATARTNLDQTHPGSEAILAVAREFENYITGATKEDQP